MNTLSRHYRYNRNQFFIEGRSAAGLAKKYGTPLYVYSRSTVEEAFKSYESAFAGVPHLICFALKANSNIGLASVIARLGGGADIVSGGELRRALKAGFSPDRIIFSGVGKTREELQLAIESKLRLINVESEEELRLLNQVATELKRPASFSLRVNPDVRAGGHPHISTGTPQNKFGVFHKNIFPLYAWARKQTYLNPIGIQAHIGSQITRVTPYKKSLAVLLDLVQKLEKIGVRIEIIDLGGGLGVTYSDETPDSPTHLAEVLLPSLKNRGLTLFLEPGRSLVAQSGVLLTRVLYRKDAGAKHFIIVDAAMNDLARPALYDAHHRIYPARETKGKKIIADVVGPICESGDYLARGRELELPDQGAVLAVMTAGAYGFAMSSQYNSRPRAAEILVSGERAEVIRERETFEDLIKGEKLPQR